MAWEIEEYMPYSELIRWLAYFELKKEREKKTMDTKPKSSHSSLTGNRMSRNYGRR